jgi:Ca2+-transporting ATPase
VEETSSLWSALSCEAVFSKLKSSPLGLTHAEASKRLAEFGLNELQAAGRISPWRILLDQLKNVLILILIAATVASAFLGHAVEAIAITIIVFFAVMLGFVQEYRAERAIEALRQMAAPTANVI